MSAAVGSLDDTPLEALVSALVEVERELADDLQRALTTYIDAETRLIALDQAASRNVSHRLARLQRLTQMRDQLERELAG